MTWENGGKTGSGALNGRLNAEPLLSRQTTPLPLSDERNQAAMMEKPIVRYLVLAFFFLASLAVRFWLLDGRWINPDEGAHLMDAFLTLKGYIPQIDFDSRQPFYVLVNAIWLKLFGVNYLAGRLLPMTCSLLTAGFVYLIAGKLFNETIALLAAILYLLLPLEILNSVIVKTEPLANLLSCASIFLLLKYMEDRKRVFLLISGILAAMGYYTRESTITLPVLALLFILAAKEESFTDTARSTGVYLLGYGLVVLVILAFYASYLGLDELVLGRLNPLGFLLNAIKKVLNLFFLVEIAGGPGGVKQAIGTKTQYSFHYLKWTVYLHSFIFAGIAWSALRLFFSPGRDLAEDARFRRSYLFLLSWLVLLTAAYIYHYKTFGYYIDYFREFLPFATIIFAAFIWETVFYLSSQRSLLYSVSLTAIGLVAVFLIENMYLDIPKGLQIVGTIGAVAVAMTCKSKIKQRSKILMVAGLTALVLFYFFSRVAGWGLRNLILLSITGGLVGITILFVSNRLRFVNICLVLSLMVLSTTFAGKIMGLGYDSVWPNSAVRKIAAVIEANSASDDEVVSGAVIWEFESHRLPFELKSHPLTFRYSMPDEMAAKIEKRMIEAPPKLVVLDGYTEKTYLEHLRWFPEVLASQYRLILEDDSAKYPLRVFKLKKEE